MTALKYEVIQMVEQMPEEQMPYVIQYIRKLNSESFHMAGVSDDKATVTSKMKAFLELEDMLVPVSPELDYDKELAEARNEKYGYFD